MHQLSHDADTDLLVLIAEQQREVKRLTAKCEESTAQAREDKRALKTAEQRLKSLVEETIADRPLFQPRNSEIPVAANPKSRTETEAKVPSSFSPEHWKNATVESLELEEETVHTLHAFGVHYVLEALDESYKPNTRLDKDELLDVIQALEIFEDQLDPQSAEEFTYERSQLEVTAKAHSKTAAEPPGMAALREHLAEEDDRPRPDDDEPERCPDCGGFLHLPTPKRKPNAKKACHLLSEGGKARAMRVPPEEVRAKRENPPELQPITDQAEPPYLMPGCPKGGTYSPEALGITESFDELYAISSAGSILSGEIRGAVEVTIHPSGIKQLYIVTSAMFASGGYRQLTLTPICYATVWYGPTHTADTLDRAHGYYGLQVQHNGRSYVVGHRDQAIEIAFGAADTPDDVEDPAPVVPDLEQLLEIESDADAEELDENVEGGGIVCEETARDGDPDTWPEDTWDRDNWYSAEVSLLHLPRSILKNLTDARLDTLGDVAGVLADDGFRALMDEPHLKFLEAAKVRAAMDLWWLEHQTGEPPWAATDPDNCPADQERNKKLIDWIQREKLGDIEPGWSWWSEFEIKLENGDPVWVVYDPRALAGSCHFDFHGPLTETGYRSHFLPSRQERPASPIVQYAEQIAREVAAETAKAKAKENRRQKKEAKAKAAQKPKAQAVETKADQTAVEAAPASSTEEQRTHWLDIPITALEIHGLSKTAIAGLIKAGIKSIGDFVEAKKHGEQTFALTGAPTTFAAVEAAMDSLCRARTQGYDLFFPEAKTSSAAEPETSSAPPDLKHYMVYHQDMDGPLSRVCLVQIGGDLLTAVSFARKRIGWQVYNFPGRLLIHGPNLETLQLSADRAWLDRPTLIERKGESVINNHTDQVPEECPPGKARLYRIIYHSPQGDRNLPNVVSTSPKAAAAFTHQRNPQLDSWRIEAKPSDEEHAKKHAKKKAETQRAVRRLYQEDDLEAMRRVEALPPDPEELTDTEEVAS